MNGQTLTLFRKTPGAMSSAEGLALHRLARSAPTGIFVECGTHSGKSAVAIASALNRSHELHLIDPDFKVPTDRILEGVRAVSGGVHTIFHIAPSVEAIPRIQGDLSFVFLDSGDHSYELCRAECDLVVPRMVRGGVLAFHDYKSQFTGVERCYNEVLASGLFEEIVIPWEDIVAEVERGGLEAGNDTYHHTELANPTFLGALRKL